MKIHELKCWPQYFALTWEGDKTFEIRNDDRFYDIGDVVLLKEYDSETEEYTGRYISARIGYIARTFQNSINAPWCVISLRDLQKHHAHKRTIAMADRIHAIVRDEEC